MKQTPAAENTATTDFDMDMSEENINQPESFTREISVNAELPDRLQVTFTYLADNLKRQSQVLTSCLYVFLGVFVKECLCPYPISSPECFTTFT